VNYRAALAWLYATQKFGIKLGLENTRQLLHALRVMESRAAPDFISEKARDPRAGIGGSPTSPPRIVHVAGTNGKGSVCAIIDSICRAADYRTGLFTSPHLISFRERIRVNGEMISEEQIARGLTAIHDLICDWDPHPTFFEITTALALKHFRDAQCEIIVLETGMGGRLDATNAIDANVSVITPINLDHQKWLGHSLAEIAAEKAGIIKTGVPVISAPQSPDAATIIKKRAQECGSVLEFVNKAWTHSSIELRGSYQRDNAAIAVAAVRRLDREISDDAVIRGLQSVEWPARFQIWNERIVIDGTHNPAGARTLVKTWREAFGSERATIILAVLRDKSIAEIIRILVPIASQFILPQIRSERAVPPTELAVLLSSITPPLHYCPAASTGAALSLAEKHSGRILITGSLHFAGEALAHLSGQTNLLEDCAQ
jgi:dihydrofolate synthase / folylpolyglutamate synthase